MQCVAQSTPMIAVSITMLRRQALAHWVRTYVFRRPVTATNASTD
jgi:hypothetical protein